MREYERFFLIEDFEDGWGMEEDLIYEDQLFDYCLEVLFIPEDKIEELNMINGSLEIFLNHITEEDISDDWYVNLLKKSKDTVSP